MSAGDSIGSFFFRMNDIINNMMTILKYELC